MALSDSKAMVLVSAGVLLGRVAYVLSDFEQELVADACGRFKQHRRQAVVTEHEWPVIEAAIVAMRTEVKLVLAQLDREAAAPEQASL
jgi:hypothetical protein